MILLDETKLTVECLIQIGNELGWNIYNGYNSIEEIEMKLEEFLDTVRVSEK